MRKNIVKIFSFFPLCTCLYLFGCMGGSESFRNPCEELGGTAWTPIFLEGRDGAKMPDLKSDGSIVYLQFSKDGKRINGMSGDNLFGGEVEMTANGSFKADKVYSTRRMGPFSEYESKFLSALNKADSFAIRNGHLALLEKGKTLIEFEPTTVPQKE